MMRPNRKFDGAFSELRRIVRVIRLEWRRLPLSYRIGVGSFSLLLLELLAALAFSLLRDMGVLSGLSQRAVVVILMITLVLAAVCMVSTVIGMVMLSFTRKGDHDKRLFQHEKPMTEAQRHDWTPPPPRSPLALPYQDEISALKENMRFLLGLLLFWLWVSWMLFGRRWFADDSIGERGFSIFFALCFTTFASMEFTRLLRRLYDRLRCYRTPFKGLEGESEHGKEK